MARELTRIEEEWLKALGPYLNMKACALGFCGAADDLEKRAKTARGSTSAETKEQRERAGLELSALRAEADIAWVNAVRKVEHLYISAVVRASEPDAA